MWGPYHRPDGRSCRARGCFAGHECTFNFKGHVEVNVRGSPLPTELKQAFLNFIKIPLRAVRSLAPCSYKGWGILTAGFCQVYVFHSPLYDFLQNLGGKGSGEDAINTNLCCSGKKKSKVILKDDNILLANVTVTYQNKMQGKYTRLFRGRVMK